ncbi:MAG: proton-conducting transporter membrane subunit [Myxococcales bacterium]|jgi:multicomponent Na+:H+ antiporter subunit D
MSNLVAAPVLLPLATAILLFPLRHRRRLERAVSIASAVGLLALASWLMALASRGEILVLPLGSWSPLVGIAWVVDRLSAVMLVVSAIISLATLVYARGGLRPERETRFFYPLHQLVVAGICGSLVTGDFFNLFVFFEVMLIASFALITLGARARQLHRSFAYVLVSLVGSLLLFVGVGVIYGTAGTVNMAELSRRVALLPMPPTFWAAVSLVLVAFALKAALVPFFFWLPDSYPEAPLPSAALFAGLLTKVGVYTLFRAVPLISGPNPRPLLSVLLGISALTMLLGVLGALGRDTVRGILSFHIVSQVGYMVFGLALFTATGLAAGLFFAVHNVLAKSALFLSGGICERVGDSGRLGQVRGLAKTHPWAAVGFFVPAMALAGIPPLSGFWAKLLVIVAGFREGAWVTTAVAIVVSFFTLASMLKIWNAVFWGAPGGQLHPERGHGWRMVGPQLSLAALTVLLGLGAAQFFSYTEAAASQLLARTPYVDAVLGSAAMAAEVTR